MAIKIIENENGTVTEKTSRIKRQRIIRRTAFLNAYSVYTFMVSDS